VVTGLTARRPAGRRAGSGPRLAAAGLAGLVVLLSGLVAAQLLGVTARALEPAHQALWLTEDER
jgi:hypothetical protein